MSVIRAVLLDSTLEKFRAEAEIVFIRREELIRNMAEARQKIRDLENLIAGMESAHKKQTEEYGRLCKVIDAVRDAKENK